MTTLFLIRHGPTEANQQIIYAGQVDDDLLPHAVPIIANVADYLAEQGIKHLITSPQRRARDSAAILSGTLGLKPQVCDAIAEMDMGPWTGLTNEQIAKSYPKEWASWRQRPSDVRLTGFEGLGGLEQRVVNWLKSLETGGSPADTVAAVTHETVIKVVLGWVVKAGLEAYRQLIVPNCSVSSVIFEDGEWKLRSVNEFVPNSVLSN
jgi:broad specificity phosphatase PhoE